MNSQHNLHIKCACGRYRYLAAENVPPDWLDETGLNILPCVYDRFVCLACCRRGRPMSTNISAVSSLRGMSDGTRETLSIINDKDARANRQA
ncbi:hypothetical protein EYC08_20740 [Tabrizicola sp. WMC-M-20]|nr:hypothetical protein EYC08_20740 [Tabrizicola sp. WMC-M-20]